MRIRTELCTSSLTGTIPSLPFLILTSLQTHNHANTSSLKRLKIITKPGLVVLHGTQPGKGSGNSYNLEAPRRYPVKLLRQLNTTDILLALTATWPLHVWFITGGFKGGGQGGHAPKMPSTAKSRQLLGDYPRPHTGAPSLDPAGGLLSPRPPELAPSKFIFWIRPCGSSHSTVLTIRLTPVDMKTEAELRRRAARKAQNPVRVVDAGVRTDGWTQ